MRPSQVRRKFLARQERMERDLDEARRDALRGRQDAAATPTALPDNAEADRPFTFIFTGTHFGKAQHVEGVGEWVLRHMVRRMGLRVDTATCNGKPIKTIADK